jgi:delta1-piperideine-2-carboxylate reductase
MDAQGADHRRAAQGRRDALIDRPQAPEKSRRSHGGCALAGLRRTLPVRRPARAATEQTKLIKMAYSILSTGEVGQLARRVLDRNGFSPAQAEAIADVVTRAEADECRSHGLYRLPGYVASVRSGRADGRAEPTLDRPIPGLARVDGRRGFAPLANWVGRPGLIAAARSNGIGLMMIRHCHHFSALWADVEPIVAEGLVCWAYVIGQLSVAPHGGSQRLMGTNPICFGWPRPQGDPFIFDFATSAVARGEVELMMRDKKNLGSGWAIAPDGSPTTDPALALQGALLPFGGYKGSALSMMVELIAGPLIGERTSRAVADLGIVDEGPPPGGALLIAIDPAAMAYGADQQEQAEHFLAGALQPGARLPSARRYAARLRTAHEGVRIDDRLLQKVTSLGG